MMAALWSVGGVLPLFLGLASGLNFTIAGGQIFTPGLAIVDAPQPGTPLGGDFLQVALDVSADGRLPLPKDLSSDSPSLIHNITIFLYSYDTGKNFTITNGTASANNASLGDIMLQEPGSTVKHVNWDWPDCLAGDGQPKDVSDARGVYNISIRQNFRLNGSEYYTIFDLPISVTNRISNNTLRPSCDGLLNPMLAPDQINMSAANAVGVLFAPGDASQLEVTGNGSGPDGFGVTAQGLGGAGRLAWWGDASWICLLGLALAVVL